MHSQKKSRVLYDYEENSRFNVLSIYEYITD